MNYTELKSKVKEIFQYNEDFRNEMREIGLSNYPKMKLEQLQEVLNKYGEYARKNIINIPPPPDTSFKKGFKMVIDGLTTMYNSLDDEFLKKKSLR